MKKHLLLLALAAGCQSDRPMTPTVTASGGTFSNGLSSIPVGNVCSSPVPVKGLQCLSDGTAITMSPAGINIRGAKGTYSLDIDAPNGVAAQLIGDPLNPSRMVMSVRGARFTVNSMQQGDVVSYIYASGANRDLEFTVSAASSRRNWLSIKVPGGRVPFTVGPGGTQFGGDEWDLRSRFGGEEWDIKIQDGAMSITALDDWESPITTDDTWDAVKANPTSLVAFQFKSGNLTASSGFVTLQSTAPFAASIQLGSLTMNAASSPCGVKLCDPKDAGINFLITGVTFPAILTIPRTSFRALRER